MALWNRLRDFAVDLALERYARVQKAADDAAAAVAAAVAAAAGAAAPPPPPAPLVPPVAPAAVLYGLNRPVGAQAPVAPVLDMRAHFLNCVQIELINWQAVPLANDPYYENVA